MNRTRPAQWILYLAAFITIVLWASAFVSIRVAIRGYHPGSMALFRYLIASAVLIPVYLKIPNRARLSFLDWFKVILLGIIGFAVYNVSLNIGEQFVSASIAAFMISLVPVLSIIIAVLFIGERMTVLMVIGVLISLFGVSLMTLGHSDHHSRLFGLAILGLAALSMAAYVCLQKPLLKRMSGVQFAIIAMWGGTLAMLIYCPQMMSDIRQASWIETANVIYMGIFPAAVAYVLWSFVLSHMSITKVASTMYAIPVIATLMGWLFINEIPGMISLLGGLLALFGAYLVNRS